MFSTVWTRVMKKWEDQEGQALVEYGLILALIAIVAVAGLVFLGHGVTNQLNNVAQNIVNP